MISSPERLPVAASTPVTLGLRPEHVTSVKMR
jgi:hypothetical protein